MVTMREVAARAGVSSATVSRVLNGTPVRAETEKRVRNAVAELSYSPNRTARALRRRHADVIALLVPDIENPYFTALARGVEDRASRGDFSVLLANTDGDESRERDYLDIAIAQDVAGIVWAPASQTSDIADILVHGRPVVAVDRRPRLAAVDLVEFDNRTCGRVAAEALRDRGATRVACITGPADVESAREREAGWRDVVGDAKSELVRHADFRVAGGHDAMLELLELGIRPDAVMVANNLMAVGALDALADAGLTTADIAVSVIGDIPFASLRKQGAFVVDLPARELGEVAADLVLARIAGDQDPPRRAILPPGP